jgi:hypothetical protein
LFPETKNSKYWGSNKKGIIKNIFTVGLKILRYLFMLFKMDQTPESGFSYFYIFAKSILFIIFYIGIKLFTKNSRN